MEAFFVVALIVALVVAVAIGIAWIDQKRTEGMAAIAKQLRLRFYPKGDNSLFPLLDQLEFFAYGDHKRIKNLLKGTVSQAGRSLEVAIFDYYYTVGHYSSTQQDSNRKTFGQTVLLIYDESLQIPSFSLRPEHIFDKVGNFFGYEDINFPDYPDFSKRYRLQGQSELAVRSLFQPNLLKFYEKQKICTEARGFCVLIFPATGSNAYAKNVYVENGKTFTDSSLLPPQEIKAFFNTGLRLVSLLKNNDYS